MIFVAGILVNIVALITKLIKLKAFWASD